MPSAFASAFNDQARVLLWNTHAEDLVVRLDGLTPGALRGVFKRMNADAPQEPDGSLTTYTGLATFVVKVADLPDISALSEAEIDRNDETWSVRHVEPQDAWTYILHLSRRKAEHRSNRR